VWRKMRRFRNLEMLGEERTRRMNVLILQEFAVELQPLYELISNSIRVAFGAKHGEVFVCQIEQFVGEVPPGQVELKTIEETDLIIANLTEATLEISGKSASDSSFAVMPASRSFAVHPLIRCLGQVRKPEFWYILL
jgi:hypothetical protein